MADWDKIGDVVTDAVKSADNIAHPKTNQVSDDQDKIDTYGKDAEQGQAAIDAGLVETAPGEGRVGKGISGQHARYGVNPNVENPAAGTQPDYIKDLNGDGEISTEEAQAAIDALDKTSSDYNANIAAITKKYLQEQAGAGGKADPLETRMTNEYINLWGSLPPNKNYIPKFIKEGGNLYDFIDQERAKPSFKHTETYRNEAATNAAKVAELLGLR